MNAPRSHYVTVLDREIHYMEWGERGAKPLIMWHGLARTGRDFDDIAQVLARRISHHRARHDRPRPEPMESAAGERVLL